MTKSKTVTKTGEIRAEDFMKQMLSEAETLESKVVIENLTSYLEKHKKHKHFLLLSHEVKYYQVFRNENGLDAAKLAEEIYGFFSEAKFLAEDSFKDMTDIREIEDSESVTGLDMWFGTTYFQLMPFDWGVESF